MNIKREVMLDSNEVGFELNDSFEFELKTGELVKAKAVKKDSDGMLFIFEDCLRDEYSMKEILNDNVLDKIFDQFPDELKQIMKKIDDNNYLRLPTEKEIFGENNYGIYESDEVKQFECMKERRNRIAFQGYKTDIWEWYWLSNPYKNSDDTASATLFAHVHYSGYSTFHNASNSLGVRPLFKI